MKNKIWTKDFSILIIGSFISTFGNVVSYFTLGVLIYRVTNNMIYSIYLMLSTIMSFFVPLIATPIFDKVSKKNLIVSLDYISAMIFLSLFILIYCNSYNSHDLIFYAVIISIVNALYNVTYSSFFPMLIQGSYKRAYAVSSMIFPIANTIILPIASKFINKGFPEYMFLFNSITFFITASIELLIVDKGIVIEETTKKISFKQRFIDGMEYITRDKALVSYIVFITINAIAINGFNALFIPFFESPPMNLECYTTMSSFSTIGNIILMSTIYFDIFKIKKEYKLLRTIYLCYPILYFVLFHTCNKTIAIFIGISCQVLYALLTNIRSSKVQNYVDNAFRGRFNSIELCGVSLGCLIGQGIAGIISNYISLQFSSTMLALIIVPTVIYFYYCNKSLKKIFNENTE